MTTRLPDVAAAGRRSSPRRFPFWLPPSPPNSDLLLPKHVSATKPFNFLEKSRAQFHPCSSLLALPARTQASSHDLRQNLERIPSNVICSKEFVAESSEAICQFNRYFSSVARTPASSHPNLHDIQGLQQYLETTSEVLLQRDDGKLLYSGLTSAELFRTWFNLQLVACEPLVDLSSKLLKSPLMRFTPFKAPLLWMIKKTAYSHFCAGEDIKEASTTLQRMWDLGLKSILDYSMEDAVDNLSCNSNLSGFLNTIDQSQLLPSGSVSFSCVKITALAPLCLLERISELLRWQHKNPEFRLPWREEGLPVLSYESPLYHVQREPLPLSSDEEKDLFLAKGRLWTLCEECQRVGLPLLVDAEYTSVQPAIDYLTYLAALQFNRSEQPLVYGTIQAYLRDSVPRLRAVIAEASKKQISLGVKLVRGAYLTRESALALSLNAPSPIHPSIQDTHKCYDQCATFMLDQVACGKGAVVIATHNFDSGRVAASKAGELGLMKDFRVQFSQLKGMADSLSLALAQAGFHVSKYLPFGPVDHVIPYLLRRAEENRGLLGNTRADRQRIRKELKRRVLEIMAP